MKLTPHSAFQRSFKDNSRPLVKVADLRFSTCSVVKLCRIDAVNEEQNISLCKNVDAIQARCGRLQVNEVIQVNIFCENIVKKSHSLDRPQYIYFRSYWSTCKLFVIKVINYVSFRDVLICSMSSKV